MEFFLETTNTSVTVNVEVAPLLGFVVDVITVEGGDSG